MAFIFNPHLFEGTGGAAGAAANGAQAAAAQGSGASAPSAKSGDQGKPAVLYGKQPASAPDGAEGADNVPDAGGAESKASTKTTSNTLEDRKAEFNRLINGEFKDQFSERMQEIINRRFKESRQMEERLQKQSGLMNILSQKYGVDASDIDGLSKAIDEDDGFFEEAAAKAGLSVSQYKEMSKLRSENEALRQSQQQKEAQAAAQQQMAAWMRDAEAVKAKFPQFDFRAELQNEAFGRLLKAGIPVEQAYTVLHQEELMKNAMAATANSVAAATADNIRARGNRPQENGASPAPGTIIKSDVNSLTKEDRKNIVRQVRRGANIQF